jgi:signal transduction histidine kinase
MRFSFLEYFFSYAFAVGAFLNVSYSIVILTADINPGMAIGVTVSMLTIFVLFALATYQKELISQRLFVGEMREREALARQAQTDSRYLAWLRQLAEFLRHEVHQPIAHINSSIEIVQLECKHGDRLMPYLTSASLSTQQVWNLVERASLATDAEAFVRQDQPQWTDRAHLLAEQLDAFRQSNSGINFRLQNPAVVRIYADPILIKEAAGNLLSNAASFADEDSIVEVALTVDEAHATITVSNKGPPLGANAEALFGPFASTRSGPSSEHQGLGLYLVRLIAEHYGGMAAIANLEDGSGVQAPISLPLATCATISGAFLVARVNALIRRVEALTGGAPRASVRGSTEVRTITDLMRVARVTVQANTIVAHIT